MPPRTPDIERARQLAQAVADGRLQAGATYSAEQIARVLGWHPKTAKRLLPLLAFTQALPFRCEWEAVTTGEGQDRRYYFRVSMAV